MPNWKSINKDNCSNYSNGSAVGIITGKISNLTIIDFDNKNTYKLLTEKHPDLKTYKTVQTKKDSIFGFDMMLILKLLLTASRWKVLT